MIPQRTIATPGLRTASHPGWRALVGHALAAPAEQPRLWLLGTLSFVLRGGAVALLAPIVVLPTQVEVRLMLGGNLGSSGLAPGFLSALAVATIVSTGIVLAILYGLVKIEMTAFDVLTGDPEIIVDADLPPDGLGPRGVERDIRTRDLFVVESLTLIVLLLCAVPLAAAIGESTLDEILLPTSAASIYDRVLGHLAAPLAIVAIALPLVDSLSALVVRRLLIGRSVGWAVRDSIGTIGQRPLTLLATMLLAWGTLLLVVVGVDWALSIGWQATRAAFLATTSIADMLAEFAPLLVATLLAGVFVAGLALAGYVAAFRNALWSVTSLRR